MKAIQEGLRLLLELARRRGVPATPSSLAEAVGINPSTARKLLEDLVQNGFAEQ
ncbi:helix-turn-helix domain-containing protein, partial [Victivallis vadensis]|uniref:helix-turn-helix domain-containing protein n=1 Tax=Victivallis vadensis TaxID=172901 RepID=UPI003465F63B